MTREEVKQICQIYDNLRRERDAATIAYNSDDTFWDHILTTYNLSQPSLPSNLDEAAEEYGRKEYSHAIHFWDEGLSKNKPEVMKEDFVNAFKVGAEWMTEQGITITGDTDDEYVRILEDVEKAICKIAPDSTVNVQIRK